MATKDTNLPCGITATQLADWKEKYGEVFHITVTKGGKTYDGVFAKPNMEVFGKAIKFLSPDPNEPLPKKQVDEHGKDITPAPVPRDLMKAGMIYFLHCRLAIDKEIESDDELKAGICMKLVGKFRAAETEIKNL